MSDVEQFEYNGEKYTANPDLNTLMEEAGLSKSHISRYARKMKKAGYETTAALLNLSKKDLKDEIGLKTNTAKQLFDHIQRVKRKGGMTRDFQELKEREAEHKYLPTGSTSLDEMMTYADGSVGLRSRTLIELFGEASTGKSQLCMTAAAMCLRPVELGGWGRGVAYIDSEGAFEGLRFEYLSRYWVVEREFLEENLIYSRVTSFDEVEAALEEIIYKSQDQDIGLLVIDSIMDPLKSQYLVGGEYLNNLQPRQQHLQQVLGLAKSFANNNNAVVIYTNHVRNEIGNFYGPDIGPQGGQVMAHASDIRIYLRRASKSDTKWFDHKKGPAVSLKVGRAQIVDCGFLPESEGFYMIGPQGISDPENYDNIFTQAEKIKEKGYLCVNARGEELPPITDGEDEITKEERLDNIRQLLYG